MHKNNYIQLYAGGGGLFGGVSQLFTSIFGTKKAGPTDNLTSRTADLPPAVGTNAINIDTSLTTNQIPNLGPGPAIAKIGSSSTSPGNSSFWSKGGAASGIASGISGGVGSVIGGFTGIPAGATDEEATVSKASGIVNGVSSGLLASGNPALMAVGAGVKAIDSIGGSLMNNNATAKAAKNFKVNQQVADSSAYGGVNANSDLAMRNGGAYRKAGLVGKLFSNTDGIKNDINTANSQQTQAANILTANKLAMDGATNSSGMFANNLIQKNYNSNMWNNGSVQFGAKGTKLHPIHIKKSHEGRFTAYKKRTGQTTEEALHSKDPHVRKMANFARNAAKWHQDGGNLDEKPKRYNRLTNSKVIKWFDKGGKANKKSDGGAFTQAGSNATKTFETYKKLGSAAKSVNLGRMKSVKPLGEKIPKSQLGGTIPIKQDHTAYKHNVEAEPDHGYTKWLNTLPERLRETNDYDLKGYFDKYGAVNLIGDAHLTDEFKKPNHVTFSKESKYSSNETPGGEWRQSSDKKWEFVPSPWNLKNVGLDSLQTYFKEHEPSSRLVLPRFEHGGTINVIADGQLHSRKHTLKDNPHLEDAAITLKGIPVVSVSEGGDIKQHAEVERDELILHYDLTKQLESLFKENTDKAAIQAGRILSKEIVKNTKDSSNKILKNA